MPLSLVSFVFAAQLSVTPHPPAPPVVLAAETVPKFDIGPTCRASSGTDGLAIGTADRCRKQEMEARDQLQQQWAKFPAGDRSQCAATAGRGIPSYVMLLSCLETARDVRRLPKQ
jgi:hypothetical protein